MMRFDIITLFPEMFAPLEHSIMKRARAAGLVEIHLHQLRAYARDKHHTVDDVPYGGGAGMVMKPAPIFEAVRHVQSMGSTPAHVILTTPQGVPLHQSRVAELVDMPRLLLLCGHYEGIDQRVLDGLVDEEISLGDFVLTGGEIPAMAIVDAVVRLIPGVIDAQSLVHESFNAGLLDFPHYTRPQVFEDQAVPEVLLSGHHAAIERWRRQEAIWQTHCRRPDLLERAQLSDEERQWLHHRVADEEL